MLKNLVPLQLPYPELKLARKKDEPQVWDILRKKWLKLTPEEWVRQHLLHFLIDHKEYPLSSLAVEGGFRLNQKLQRTDILVYKNGSPQLLAECKSPQVKLNQAVFDQASRYNLHYRVPYIVLSNGLTHYAARVDFEAGAYQLLHEIPSYHAI